MEEAIKKVSILPGCIGCGLCQAIVPEVFQVRDVSRIKEGVEYGLYKEKIELAVRSCPVGAILYER